MTSNTPQIERVETPLEELEEKFVSMCRESYFKRFPERTEVTDLRAVCWAYSDFITSIVRHKREMLALFKKHAGASNLDKKDRQWWAKQAKELEEQLTLIDPHTVVTEGVAPDGVDNAAG